MTLTPFNPRPYQELIIDKIVSCPRCAIFAGMGMGKTSATLFAVDYLQQLEGAGAALVLAPLRVAATTWPEEAHKWAGLSLKVSPIVGDAKARKAALKANASVFTLNYENIPWLVEELNGEWPFDIIIADESTRLKSFRLGGKSVRARALGKVAWRSSRFIELTGTPAPNGLLDLWGQLWFLDRGQRLGRSISAYTTRYFRPRKVGRSPFAVQYEPTEWAQESIQEKIRDISISLNAADYFPIEKPIKANIEVELPSEARKVYERLKREMYAQLEDGSEIEAVSAAALTVKCLQAASGALYHDDTWSELHTAKIEALKSIIAEANGAPVLVAYHWKADADRILRAIPGARLLDKSPATIKAWNAGKIPVLLAHPASAGHGLNLQDGGNILVFFSHWWDLEQYQQIIERIGPTRQLQAGHPRPVWLYHIIAKDTIDGLVMERRESKKTVQDLLLESLNSSGLSKSQISSTPSDKNLELAEIIG